MDVRSLDSQVLKFHRKYAMFSPGPVVVAVSGGADSLVLLRVLLTLRDTLDITLHVATFDHQIRGTAGAEDVRFVEGIAALWSVPISTGRADVPALAMAEKAGIEESARKARYQFLAQVAREVGAATIATGHNRDDQAETVLLHVVRGSGTAGLRGILPKSPLSADPSILLVRPLLDTPRREIEAYLSHFGIEPRQDATNQDTNYTRNRLRHEILPLLEQINPQVRTALARTAEILQQDYETLLAQTPRFVPGSRGGELAREVFLQLSPAQQRITLRESAGGLTTASISFERIESAVTLIREHAHGVRTPMGGGIWLVINNGLLILHRDPVEYPADCPALLVEEPLVIAGPGDYPLPGTAWILEVQTSLSARSRDPYSAILAISPGSHIALRRRRNGDRFAPMGMNGRHQKLSDILINEKVPVEWRDQIPLLTVDDQVAWFIAPTLGRLLTKISGKFGSVEEELTDLWQFRFKRTA